MSTETSVIMSLAQLAVMEEERIAKEEAQRIASRERQAREQREADARRRAAEAAELAADAEQRARRQREEAEARARAEAREKAAADVARIEAEARARLEADNAARAHELAVLRVQTEGGRRRLGVALAAAIGVALVGGAAGAFGFTRRVGGLTHELDQLREGQAALARERESAKATELVALDRRKAALEARPRAAEAKEARFSVEAARGALDPRAPDRDRLRAYADALDALEARVLLLDEVAALDRRLTDLAAWAGDGKRAEVLVSARAAEARAKQRGAGEAEVRAYEAALDRARVALAQPTAAGGRVAARTPGPAAKCLDPNDPLCGFNGQTLSP